ncbi:DNA-3-methyladenine glycosylase family protein [Nonomuraea ferruginea]
MTSFGFTIIAGGPFDFGASLRFVEDWLSDQRPALRRAGAAVRVLPGDRLAADRRVRDRRAGRGRRGHDAAGRRGDPGRGRAHPLPRRGRLGVRRARRGRPGAGRPAAPQPRPAAGVLLESVGGGVLGGDRAALADAHRRPHQAAHRRAVRGDGRRGRPRARRLPAARDAPGGRGLGLPAQKEERIRGLARAALDGVLTAEHLRSLAPEQALAELRALPGVGPFSAGLILIRGAGAPDAFPGDEPRLFAILREVYGLPEDAPAAAYRKLADHWRPYRSWASFLFRAATYQPVRGNPGDEPR